MDPSQPSLNPQPSGTRQLRQERLRTLLPLAGAIVVVLAVLIGVAIWMRHNNGSGQSAQHNTGVTNLNNGQYVDPVSGETISNPAGKAPDKYGVPSNTPNYLGFEGFLNQGLSLDQVNNVKTAFYNYSKANKNFIKQVSLDPSAIQSAGTSHGVSTINFNVVLNGTTTDAAVVHYTGLETIELILTNPQTKAQLYDSGNIGNG